MRKDEYKQRSGELRRLLKHVKKTRSRGGQTSISGIFGAFYDSRYGLWRIVNSKNNTVIATIKHGHRYSGTNHKALVRYRHNSFYRGILSDWKQYVDVYDPRYVGIIKSLSLGKHRNSAVNDVAGHIMNGSNHLESEMVPLVSHTWVNESTFDARSSYTVSVDQNMVFSETVSDLRSEVLDRMLQEYEGMMRSVQEED